MKGPIVDSVLEHESLLGGAISFLVLFPLFFQLENGIFRDPVMVFDSRGLIGRVPIPISVLGCLAGILIVIRYRYVCSALAVVCLSFCLMIMTSFFASTGLDRSALISMAQFLLPMTALVLGQLYQRIDDRLVTLSWVFFAIVCSAVFLELFSSRDLRYTQLVPQIYLPYPYMQHPFILCPRLCWPYIDMRSLALFSIYQHFQYVPVVFASAFVTSMFTLHRHRLSRWIWVFAPVMFIYAIVSTSLTAILLFVVGCVIYAVLYSKLKPLANMRFLLICCLILSLIAWYFYSYRGQHMLEEKLYVFKGNEISDVRIPGIDKRLEYWKSYGRHVTGGLRTFLVGSARPTERSGHTSAHNYYLDFIYRFGFLSFVPLLILIGMTLRGIWKRRKYIAANPALAGLTFVVLYLLFVENMLKVGMRQPYPGIFTFFLWGILISQLSLLPSGKAVNNGRLMEGTRAGTMPGDAA